jgi:hypothetical protein
MKVKGLFSTLPWSCDLVAMVPSYDHFKMTAHWDNFLTLML